MIDPDVFAESDGLSDYSFNWWKAWKEGKATTHLAMHETLAEMARLKLEGTPIEHMGQRILSYRTKKPTKKDVAKAAKVWSDLYDMIEKRYPETQK